MVRTSPSNAGDAGSIPSRDTKIPHASWPKKQNIKQQKGYCNRFYEDFKNGPLLWGGRAVPKGGDIGTLMADLRCCMAETNTTLQSNYPPIKNKFKKEQKKVHIKKKSKKQQ